MTDHSDADLPAVPDAIISPDGQNSGDAVEGGLDLGGALGGLDMGSLLDMAGQVQQQMEAAQAKANDTIVEGSAGGGAVRVTATGSGDFKSVTISPEVAGTDDIDMLQDLVLAAVRDAMEKVQTMQAESMGGLGGLGGLGDLFG